MRLGRANHRCVEGLALVTLRDPTVNSGLNIADLTVAGWALATNGELIRFGGNEIP